MEVQAVAKVLDIHPVMLSRWRQELRERRLRGTPERPPIKKVVVREIKQLQRLEKAHALLQEEHELLKKAIRFCSETRPASSRSSRVIERTSR
jgi:transposase